MFAVITLKPKTTVDSYDVYDQFHPNANDVDFIDGNAIVTVSQVRLGDWLNKFYMTYGDGSGGCQRYDFVSAIAE